MKIKELTKSIIYYITGGCGSGKTHWITQRMATGHKYLNENRRFLFVSPSTSLCEEVYKKLSKNMKTKLIHNETCENVGKEIVEALDFHSNDTGVCIIVTQQAYDSIINSSITSNGFQVVYDESISKITWWDYEIDNAIKMGAIFNFARNTGKMTMKRPYDQAHKSLRDPFNDIRNHILNKKRYVYALPYSDGSFVSRYKNRGSSYQSCRIISIPSKDYFPTGTIILTADLDSCEFLKIHQEHINTKELKMVKRLEDKKVIIECFTDKNINSTNLKQDNKQFIKRVFNYVKNEMEVGLIFRNKAEKSVNENGDMYYPTSPEPFKLPEINPKWIDIPINVHGVNSYDHIHAIFILGTLNPPPSVLKSITESLGISKEEFYSSKVVETYHQMIMRTSLRDPECREPVKVYMIDKITAELIKEKLVFLYDMDVEIVYRADFDSVSDAPAKYYETSLDESERQRIKYLVNKALKGKIKNKDYEFEIIKLSKNGRNKSNRRILELDEEHILLTGEKL